MADTPFLINIGPCAATYGSVSIPHSFGSTHVKVVQTTKDATYAQTGTTPRSRYVTGTTVDIEVPITEPTIEMLAAVIPGSTLGSGTLTKSLTITTAVGIDLLDVAEELILKPVVNDVVVTDKTLWITIPKAVVSPNFDIVLDSETQRVYTATFSAMVDSGTLAVFGFDSNA